MKKFNFTLEKMLSYKDQVLEREKDNLSQLRYKKKSIENKIEEHRTALYEIERTFQKKVFAGLTASEMKYHRFQMNNLNLQIDELKIESQKLDPLIERQTDIVVEVSQEVSGLDKLKEKQYDEYKKLAMKAEETIISEFVVMSDFREKNMR